jgi:hypothetical protein
MPVASRGILTDRRESRPGQIQIAQASWSLKISGGSGMVNMTPSTRQPHTVSGSSRRPSVSGLGCFLGCVLAVGSWLDPASAATVALIEHWDGTSWAIIPSAGERPGLNALIAADSGQ